ncbi:Holliday junction resolvase RuvX [bacterium]|nr:Holliday junction resolvase RuvX [bacterium]
MRLLGIDYGDKKIGLAFGDSTVDVAVPLDVVPNMGDDTIRVFAKRAKTEDIDAIVVGVPLSTGEHHSSEQLDKARAFIKKLEAAVAIPVIEEDESFTTADSIRLQREEGAKGDEDALAAMLILQSFMSRHGG